MVLSNYVTAALNDCMSNWPTVKNLAPKKVILYYSWEADPGRVDISLAFQDRDHSKAMKEKKTTILNSKKDFV